MPKATPEDYKFANNPILQDANKIDHLSSFLLITTVPSEMFTDQPDPDGRSEWIVHGPTEAKIINTPGFPKPVPKPKTSNGIQPAYIVKSTPDMGLGVFATRDIKMNELIFAERPLLVSPRNINNYTALNVRHYDFTKTRMEILLMEWEKMLEVAVGRMEPEDRKAFMELTNIHKEDGSGPIHGIIRTNGFGVNKIFDGPNIRADGSNGYGGVIKIGSPINHRYMRFLSFFRNNILIKNVFLFYLAACLTYG